MAILPIQLFGDFSNPSTDPEGIDTRRDGDNNIRALAASLKLSFPALTDTAVTLTGARINDAARRSDAQTISAGWTFSVSQNFAASINFTAVGDQTLFKSTGDLKLQTSGGGIVLQGPVDHLSGVSNIGIVQPASVACATITVPAATGNPAPLSNQSGGATGWSAVWTSSNIIALTHNIGSSAYVHHVANSAADVALGYSGKSANTINLTQTTTMVAGQTIEITITLP